MRASGPNRPTNINKITRIWLAGESVGVKSRLRPVVLIAETTSNRMLMKGADSKRVISSVAKKINNDVTSNSANDF